eukprot:119320-Pleurochrysis_carterae.AAC.1
MAKAPFSRSPKWLDKLGKNFAMQAANARRAQEAELERRPRDGLEQQSVANSRGRRGAIRSAHDEVAVCGECDAAEPGEPRRSCRPVKRNSRVVDAAAPLESSEVKRAAGVLRRPPRLQCRNVECVAKKALLSRELLEAKAKLARLQREGARAAGSCLLCVNLRAENQQLKQSTLGMDESRRATLRSLASVRGRFDGMRNKVKKFKEMCDVAQKALAANVAELKALVSKSEGDARKAGRDARSAVSLLQDELKVAMRDLAAATEESAAQQAAALDAVERQNTARAVQILTSWKRRKHGARSCCARQTTRPNWRSDGRSGQKRRLIS